MAGLGDISEYADPSVMDTAAWGREEGTTGISLLDLSVGEDSLMGSRRETTPQEQGNGQPQEKKKQDRQELRRDEGGLYGGSFCGPKNEAGTCILNRSLGLGNGSGGGDLRSIAAMKERELHDINEYHIRSLEKTLTEKDAALAKERKRFAKLREDFTYNLRLIEDRDFELERYDTTFAQVKSVVRDKDDALSEAKRSLAECESRLEHEVKRRAELESFHTERAKDARAAADSERWALEDAARCERERFDVLKTELEARLRAKDDDLDTQRRDLEEAFEMVAKQRAAEAAKALEASEERLREVEEPLAAIADEAAAACEQARIKGDQARDLTTKLELSEKKVKDLTLELEDVHKLMDSKIAELHVENEKAARVKQSILDEYESKMADLLTSLHTVEKQFVVQQEQYELQLQTEVKRNGHEVSAKTQGLEARLTACMGKLREAEEQVDLQRKDFSRAKWDLEEQLTMQARQLETLKSEMGAMQERRLSATQETKSQAAEKASEILRLREALATAQGAKAEADKEVALLRAEEQTHTDTVNKMRAQCEALEKRVQEEIVAAGDKVAAGDRAATETKQAVEALQTQNDRLLATNAAQDQLIYNLENRVTELSAELATVQGEVRSAWATGGGNSKNNTSNEQETHPKLSTIDQFFEGDLGPSSPIGSWASHSPLVGASNTGGSDAQIQQKQQQQQLQLLVSENQKLTTALRTMRSEMETMSRGLLKEREENEREKNELIATVATTSTAPVEPTNHPNENIMLSANAAEENRLLHLQSQKLYNYIQILQNKEPSRDDEGQVLRDLLDTQARLLQLFKAKLAQSLQFPNDLTEGEETESSGRSAGALKAELVDLRADLKRVVTERDSLAELSNKLSANLKRSSVNSVAAEQLRQVEKQITETFQIKIKSVERALEQVVAQNRLLKQQLRAHRAADHEKTISAFPTNDIGDQGKLLESELWNDAERPPGSASGSCTSSTSQRGGNASKIRDLKQVSRQRGSADSMSAGIIQTRLDRREKCNLSAVGVGVGTSQPPVVAGDSRSSSSVQGKVQPRQTSTAREQLELIRKRLDQTSHRSPKSGISSSSTLRLPLPKESKVKVGRTKIRNYAVRGNEE